MLVAIGDIAAKCPRCGGGDFDTLTAGALRLASELKCTGCGANLKYLALLDQIGEEAMRRANEAIEELKRRPKK